MKNAEAFLAMCRPGRPVLVLRHQHNVLSERTKQRTVLLADPSGTIVFQEGGQQFTLPTGCPEMADCECCYPFPGKDYVQVWSGGMPVATYDFEQPPMQRKFEPACYVVTTAAQETLDHQDITAGVLRHCCGDWGECCAEDRELNERNLKNGGRLHSVFTDLNGTTFWILTEHDRSVCTVLLPGCY